MSPIPYLHKDQFRSSQSPPHKRIKVLFPTQTTSNKLQHSKTIDPCLKLLLNKIRILWAVASITSHPRPETFQCSNSTSRHPKRIKHQGPWINWGFLLWFVAEIWLRWRLLWKKWGTIKSWIRKPRIWISSRYSLMALGRPYKLRGNSDSYRTQKNKKNNWSIKDRFITTSIITTKQKTDSCPFSTPLQQPESSNSPATGWQKQSFVKDSKK